MVVFQALTWEARDEFVDGADDPHHLVSIFGKTESGESVCVTTKVLPYFFVRLGDSTMAKEREIYAEIEDKCPGALVNCSIVRAKDMGIHEQRGTELSSTRLRQPGNAPTGQLGLEKANTA